MLSWASFEGIAPGWGGKPHNWRINMRWNFRDHLSKCHRSISEPRSSVHFLHVSSRNSQWSSTARCVTGTAGYGVGSNCCCWNRWVRELRKAAQDASSSVVLTAWITGAGVRRLWTTGMTMGGARFWWTHKLTICSRRLSTQATPGAGATCMVCTSPFKPPNLSCSPRREGECWVDKALSALETCKVPIKLNNTGDRILRVLWQERELNVGNEASWLVIDAEAVGAS